ncbi:ABC-F family ATP-binding cassette domain-containing protein [Gorillibacterium sp. sgz5001074]|uniref:ABC-F family ATP-binding cassette domain-containing protein n=1 Tax=Gorillibacterium sp. sgz5001074 TaxID=3446695 RepID=UPI003F6746D8
MLLQASNITKSYGTRAVLSNITVQVQDRERIGLVGVNGAGKSTLLQIISGEMSYDSGEIFKSKEVRVGYLAQNSGLNTDRTIWAEMLDVFTPLLETERELREMEAAMAYPKIHEDERIYEELLHKYSLRQEWFREKGGYEMESRIRSILHGMGFGTFPPETVISTLSGGQRTRLALAKMLLQQPDVLMLDEPTNHLDIQTLTWLEGYLRSYPGAILVVSHDRYFLDALVTVIYEIERHQSKRYTGNYTRFMDLKAAEYESQMKQFEKQQDEIARMEDFIQKNIVRASTTKRAQSRRKALEKLDRIDKPMGDLKRASFSFEAGQKSGRDVLDANSLAVSFDGGPMLFRNATFQLSRGDTAALIGPNGIGKSTLLKVLTGQLKPAMGTYYWGTNVQIGFYDQEQSGLNPVNTVLDEVWNEYPHLEEARIRTVLGNFLFSGEDVFKRISSLSGGEKARVALAKLMLQNANVLILDEPTNHLDLYSKEVLEAALMDYEGTLLFISHDRYFLNKMADRILELSPDGITGYLGNYDDYLEKKLEQAEFLAEGGGTAGGAGAPGPSKGAGGLGAPGSAAGGAAAAESAGAGGPSAAVAGKGSYEADKQAKREERNRQRRLEQLEQDIARLEGEIAALEEELTRPEVYQDYVLVQEKNEAIDKRKLELEQAYAAWEGMME